MSRAWQHRLEERAETDSRRIQTSSDASREPHSTSTSGIEPRGLGLGATVSVVVCPGRGGVGCLVLVVLGLGLCRLVSLVVRSFYRLEVHIGSSV